MTTFNVVVEDRERNLINNEIKKIDSTCSTTLQSIGNELIMMNAYVKSFQNKYAKIDFDGTVSSVEKSKQKNILLNNFFNDNNVYNTIKTVTDKLLQTNFDEFLCVSGNDKTLMCKVPTNNFDVANVNIILSKYKKILKDLLKWLVHISIERQKYCEYISVNQTEMNKFFENVIDILDPSPSPPIYYSYLYGVGGLVLGLFIGWLVTYLMMRKGKDVVVKK